MADSVAAQMLTAIVSILGGWRATAFAVFALLGVLSFTVERIRLNHAQFKMTAHLAADAKATAEAQIAARTHEYEAAVAAAKVAQDYEEAKQHAQAESDSVVDDLRAGTVKLRDRWSGCQADLSKAHAAAAKPDAAEQDRRESAGRIVQFADSCDAQVKALQDFIRSERVP